MSGAAVVELTQYEEKESEVSNAIANAERLVAVKENDIRAQEKLVELQRRNILTLRSRDVDVVDMAEYKRLRGDHAANYQKLLKMRQEQAVRNEKLKLAKTRLGAIRDAKAKLVREMKRSATIIPFRRPVTA